MSIAPTVPGSLTINPAAPALIGVAWLPSTDPDGNSANIVYERRYWDGAWQAIAGTQPGLSYDWVPPSALRGRIDIMFSVRAKDETATFSAWADSDAFTVPAYTPTDLLASVTPLLTEISWVLSTNADIEYWDGVQWRTLVTDLAAQNYSWDTSKRKGTNVKVRVRSRDGAGVTGAWVESATFDLTGKFVGSLWKALQSYASLEGLWKFNEASSGTLPIDSSGKGRNITNMSTFTAGRPSIVFNRPADTARRRVAFGSGAAVLHAGGTWYDALKTLMVWMKPANANMGGASGVHLALYNRAVIEGRAADLTHLEFQASGFGQIDLGLPPAVGQAGMLTLVAPKGAGSRVAAYVNATNRYAATITTSATVVNQIGAVSASVVDADYQGFAAFSEEFDALQVGWIYQVSLNTPNDAPATPGAFTEPDAGVDYDLSIAVAWGASADPQGDAVTYSGEYWDPEQLLWLPLFGWQAGTAFTWNTSGLIEFDGYQVRVKARDIYDEESDWQVSSTFNIAHDRDFPAAPLLEWVWGSYGYVGFYGSAFSSAEPGATARSSRWRISTSADMSGVIGSWRVFGPNYRLGWNARSLNLATDTDYWVDVQYEDQVGIWGLRSEPVRGRTARNVVGGGRYIAMRDSSPYARHGSYGTITGTDGASFLNHGVGADGLAFPGHLLVGAPAGAHGALSAGAPVRGQWRVYEDDPKVIGEVAREDGLQSATCIWLPTTLEGAPACTPTSILASIAPDFGILLRLFLPQAAAPGLRYGVLGFHSALNLTSPLIGSKLMRIYMRDQLLTLEGWRGYYDGYTDVCNPTPFYLAEWGDDTTVIGEVTPGELYTLRLWTKGFVPSIKPCANPGNQYLESGNTRIQTNHGIDYVSAVTLGLAAGWVDIGFDANNPPQLSAGSNLWPGVVLEAAAWLHPEIRYDTAELPWIATQSDDVSSEAITASPGLQFHYRLNDPTSPELPVVDGEIEEL